MSFSENNIEYKDVVDLLGTVNIEQLFEMAGYVIKEDTKKCLEILNEFVVWGKDIKNLIDDLIDHFRNLMVCKVSKDLDEIISLPEEIVDQLKAQAETIEVNDIIRILNVLSTTQDAIKVSSNPRVLAEVSIMKLSQPMFDDSKEALLKRISTLEDVIRSGKANINNNDEKEKEIKEIPEKYEVEDEEVFYEEVKNEDVELIEKSWENILTHIKKDKNMPVYAILREAREFNVSANNLYIVFDDNFAFAKNKLSDDKTRNYIEGVIREILNRSFSIKIVLKSESKNISLEIKKEQKDKGEEILKSVFPNEIIDIKQSINENEIK
jgi:DNA polymerase-3 subunit gamma/tau